MRKLPILILLASVLAGCGEDSTPTRPNTFVPLTSIEVRAEPSAVPALTDSRVSVIGDFSGQFTRDITAEAALASLDPSVAAFSDPERPARLLAVSPGTATITAEVAGFDPIQTELTVTDAVIQSLSVQPAQASLAVGLSRDFALTGTFTDGTAFDLTSLADWSSSDEAVATVSNEFESAGRVSALAEGSAEITAAFDGATSTASLTVTAQTFQSLAIVPASPDLPAGFTLQLTATATLSDGSTEDVTEQAAWDSSDNTIATVGDTAGANGLVEGIAQGSAEITATFRDLEAATAVQVTDAALESLTLDPVVDTIDLAGGNFRFTVAGTFSDGLELDLTDQVTFTSSDTAVAEFSTVAGFEGTLTPRTTGEFILTAGLNGLEVSRTITVR